MKINVKVEKLTQQFGSHLALDSVSFETNAINCLVLIGPSGGGKSTLLRLLAGLDIPAGGEIYFNGQQLQNDEKSLHTHRKSVGTVFQSFNLFPHLTAWDNLMLPLIHVHQWPLFKAKERLNNLLERFQLLAHAHKFPTQLSGGQKQRIAIIRALAIDPFILFLDEPTSALDPEMMVEVLHMIQELKGEGKNIVLVTHQMEFAKRVADEIVFIGQGKILDLGTSKYIFEQTQVQEVRQFIQKILL
jgi:polar amino acid transport system ATP-binding protein